MKSPIKLCLLISIFAVSNLSAFPAVDDFTIIKERVVEELLKSSIDYQKIKEIRVKLQPDGSFQDINYEDLSRRAGFPHRYHTYWLVDLAKAYQQKTSKLYKDSAVKKEIIRGLRYWVEHDFFGDNWHNNQITTPTNLVHLLLIMDKDLPEELIHKADPIIGRAHMNASGARPSGDRIVIAGILAKHLLFKGDRIAFKEIIKIIEGELKFSTGQRGIQHDYSFHHRHDRVNNTTSYGYGKYANAFGEWSYYVANTQFAFSVEKINQLVDYYLDGIYKQLVYGVYTDISVKNRSISRQATFKPQGTLEIERLLFGTDYRQAELEEIIKLRKGEVKPSSSFSKFFWQTEHFVFQRPNFYTTVRMFSTRNRNMEKPYNGPGKTTHHRADGTNYLMLQGDEYHNIWPVYNWQKISGTTILQKPALPSIEKIQLDGLTDFVGAVSDGLYGAVAFDFRSPHDGVKAKKAWFFFDEEYVCLGTAINADSNLPVATTVNQVLMKSKVRLKQADQVHQLVPGRHELKQVKWIHQDKIGYLFPEPTTINISNQAEQGRWSDITDQKNISQTLISEDVFSVWFDHGNRPDNAAYQYIVVPDISEQELSETSKNNRQIEILSNTGDIQAVKSNKLNQYQLAFYTAGELEIAAGKSIRMDSQGMALLKMEGDKIKSITLADPSRKLSRILLTVPGMYPVKGSDFMTLPNQQQNNTLFLVDLPQGVYAGKSVIINIQ